jgi:protein gp37
MGNGLESTFGGYLDMAENSKIEWTHHTFNPWIGCTKVSQGCKHCYAETLMDHRYGKVQWGPQGTRVRTSAANWKKPLQWNRTAQAEGRRYRVFCASLADVFEIKPDQPEMAEWRMDLFNLIKQTPNLDWLLLTKRPEDVRISEPLFPDKPMPSNVWIGTSVEDQATADERIPHLLNIPAAVRFLSMEPLLGPVDLGPALYTNGVHKGHIYYRKINWVIVGGESGPDARPMNPGWARSIRDQCAASGTPFLFKQWGEFRPAEDWESHPGNVSAASLYRFWDKSNGNPTSEVLIHVGKKAAGRTLDGREWNEYPAQSRKEDI